MLKRYMGVKLIDAEPMNLGEYNKMRGWLVIMSRGGIQWRIT